MDHVTHNQGCVPPRGGTLERTRSLPPRPMALGLDEITGQGTKEVLGFVGWGALAARSAGETCL